MTERGRGDVVRDASRLAIGPSRLEWIGDTLRITLDEVSAPIPRRIRGTIDVAVGSRPVHATTLDADGRHRWGVIAPAAPIAVALDRPGWRWSGTAYVDGNRGDRPLERDFVRWDWSRAHGPDGRAAVVYDIERRDGSTRAIAERFDADGRATPFTAPPAAALRPTRWGLARGTRSDAGTVARVTRSFEDSPFYARALTEARWAGEPVVAVHEHLSLDRFERRWVRALLPFRMPRWPVRR